MSSTDPPAIETPQGLAPPGDKETIFNFVVHNAPIVLWALDSAGVFTFSGGQGLEQLGLGLNELVGRSVFDLYPEGPEVLEVNRRALSGERVRGTVHAAG